VKFPRDTATEVPWVFHPVFENGRVRFVPLAQYEHTQAVLAMRVHAEDKPHPWPTCVGCTHARAMHSGDGECLAARCSCEVYRPPLQLRGVW
jgi:hypothetical protein